MDFQDEMKKKRDEWLSPHISDNASKRLWFAYGADWAHDFFKQQFYNLNQENARLREALEDIVHCIYGNEATFQWVEKKAREALKGGE